MTRTSPPANGVPAALSATVPPMSPVALARITTGAPANRTPGDTTPTLAGNNDKSSVRTCMTLSWFKRAHTSPGGVVTRELGCGMAVAAEARRRYLGERRRGARIGKSEISRSRRSFNDRWRPADPPPFANPNDRRGISTQRRREKTMEGAVGRVNAGAGAGGVRLDVRRASGFALASIRQRSGRRQAELQQRDEQQRRSEEHTSELQSHLNLVCRLLLEKKN